MKSLGLAKEAATKDSDLVPMFVETIKNGQRLSRVSPWDGGGAFYMTTMMITPMVSFIDDHSLSNDDDDDDDDLGSFLSS